MNRYNIHLFIVGLLVVLSNALRAQQPIGIALQQRGEVVVSVQNSELSVLDSLGTYSIESIDDSHSLVYLNKDEYAKFQELNIAFVQAQTPSLMYEAKIANSAIEMQAWDTYPSYETYLSMMNDFASDHPDYCKLDTIGTSVDGRLLLALKISDNVNEDESEPEFFYTSSMHGDELTGFVLMLRLADYLLNNLDDDQVSNLVNNIEIYINPLANPDGTYRYDNSTVNGATRSNINGVNLNRNFPDPDKGEHPDGYAWQAETVAMMDYMEGRNFVMSMNFHGGAEVVNYPWDTYEHLHADNDWFVMICREYADLVHEIDPDYLTDYNDGITNGYAWYSIDGGRQDYVTYYLHGREVTTELSTIKLPSADLLPGYWNKNYKSLLKYMENTLHGISGSVTNELNEAIQAKVSVVDHDADSSFVYSQQDGKYFRYIKSGSYNLTFEADGYQAVIVENVEVNDYESTLLNVQFLDRVGVESDLESALQVYPNPASSQVNFSFVGKDKLIESVEVFNSLGQRVWFVDDEIGSIMTLSTLYFPSGIYTAIIKADHKIYSKKIILQK